MGPGRAGVGVEPEGRRDGAWGVGSGEWSREAFGSGRGRGVPGAGEQGSKAPVPGGPGRGRDVHLLREWIDLVHF